MNKIILVDGNNLLFRSYYATAYSGNMMKNSKGFPTNALFGFVNMINKIITEEKPTHIMVAFDKGKTYEYVDAFVSKSSNFNYTNEFDNNLYNNNYISKSTSFSNLENNSLRLIQQSYNERISKLYKDFEGYYKEILKKNINDIINEQIFIEKEKEISNLITKSFLLF